VPPAIRGNAIGPGSFPAEMTDVPRNRRKPSSSWLRTRHRASPGSGCSSTTAGRPGEPGDRQEEMIMEPRGYRSFVELLHRERYTPEEAADLLQMGVDVLRHAAFAGDLNAEIIDHDLISLRREDLLAWLADREVCG
jgi:hypothetical protein